MKRLMFAAGKEKHLKADRLFVNFFAVGAFARPNKMFSQALVPAPRARHLSGVS